MSPVCICQRNDNYRPVNHWTFSPSIVNWGKQCIAEEGYFWNERASRHQIASLNVWFSQDDVNRLISRAFCAAPIEMAINTIDWIVRARHASLGNLPLIKAFDLIIAQERRVVCGDYFRKQRSSVKSIKTLSSREMMIESIWLTIQCQEGDEEEECYSRENKSLPSDSEVLK